jgi:hypothetical protein
MARATPVDRDHDGKLSEEEFVARTHTGPSTPPFRVPHPPTAPLRIVFAPLADDDADGGAIAAVGRAKNRELRETVTPCSFRF